MTLDLNASGRHRYRALATGLAAGACVAATLGLASPASAAYTAQVKDGTLQITGDGASDKLALVNGPTSLALDVGEDGTADFTFDRSTFMAVNVKAGGGNDDVVVVRGGGASDKPITIHGGRGNDTLRGGDGADLLLGGPGDDVIDGNGGADLARLGGGDDRFVWDPGDGSDTVEGQGGRDALDFNGSNAPERIDVTANGTRVRLSRNIANIAMDLNGIEALGARALGGSDTITVNDLTGTDLKTTAIDLAATGGGGDAQADTVITNGTPGADRVDVGAPKAGAVSVSGLAAQVQVTGSEAANDRVNVATLAGDDTITSHVGVSGAAIINVDGGVGTDTATYEGTSSADSIAIAPNGSAVRTSAAATTPVDTTAVESLVVSGLAGADTVTGANGLAPLGRLTIDGGSGNDTLSGGDGDDVLIGGPGNDTTNGNRGNDVALLGAGNDRFTWNPGDGSDTVEGQAGQDVLGFSGSNAPERMDVSANGSRVRLLRDVAAITIDLDGVERLELNALAGADAITVNDLTGTDLKTTAIDLAATGGGGDAQADTIITNGTNQADRVAITRDGAQVLTTGLAAQTRIVGSEAANDTFRVNTRGGDDRVTVAPDVSDLIKTIVDLGADE